MNRQLLATTLAWYAIHLLPVGGCSGDPNFREGPTTPYSDLVGELTTAIDAAEQSALDYSDDWTRFERLASLLRARAQLTGSYDDLDATRSALDAAFDLAAEGSGPHLERAAFELHVHRPTAAEASIGRADARAIQSDPYAANVALHRALSALHTGDEAYGEHALFEAIRLDPSTTTLGSLAVWWTQSGRLDDGFDLFFEAEAETDAPDALVSSWLDLQRGLIHLERGALDDAMLWYKRAADHVPGYWLVDEHIAEVLVEQGRLRKAETIYRSVIAATDAPEFYDALANVLEAQGEDGTEWIAAAEARFEERLARWPESTASHALDHYLEVSPNPSRALELAEINRSARPNGEAWWQLARAHQLAGDIDRAIDAIEHALEGRWTSVDLHVTASELFVAAGDLERATAHWAIATSIRPSFDD